MNLLRVASECRDEGEKFYALAAVGDEINSGQLVGSCCQKRFSNIRVRVEGSVAVRRRAAWGWPATADTKL